MGTDSQTRIQRTITKPSITTILLAKSKRSMPEIYKALGISPHCFYRYKRPGVDIAAKNFKAFREAMGISAEEFYSTIAEFYG